LFCEINYREFKNRPSTLLETKQMSDYVVNDIALADFGRKELDIAETEIPG
jgi:hypothetical protein